MKDRAITLQAAIATLEKREIKSGDFRRDLDLLTRQLLALRKLTRWRARLTGYIVLIRT